jgi:hypothetical protein
MLPPSAFRMRDFDVLVIRLIGVSVYEEVPVASYILTVYSCRYP